MNKNGGWFLGSTIFVIIIALFGVGITYGHGKALIDDKVYMGMVSHTEYASGETGQIVARIVDFQGNPIVANCYATIITPTKAAFVTNQSMTASTIAGDYYKTFTTPSTAGIYEYRADCYYSPNKKQSATNSFHLSPALNEINQINSTVATTYLSMGGNFTKLYKALQGMNSTMISKFTSLNATMISKFTGISVNMTQHFSNLNQSMKNALFSLNSSLWNKINTLSFSQTNYTGRFNSLDRNLTKILSREVVINNTVNNIWDKVSLNITVELDSMKISLASILKNTKDINSTVNTIKSNQENQVYMQVVSG